MENVMMISRHRQWRAWQFGRRHSGMLGGRGTSTYGTGGDGDDFWSWVETWPTWLKAAVVAVVVGGCLLTMVVWGPVVLLKVLFGVILAMVCLLCLAWVALQLVIVVRMVVDWMKELRR